MTGNVLQGKFAAAGPPRADDAAGPVRAPVPPPVAKFAVPAPSPSAGPGIAQPAARLAPPKPPVPVTAARPAAGTPPHGAAHVLPVNPRQIGLSPGGGKPLATSVQAQMKAAFRADFSAVRVHEGPQASRIGAVAFTTGNDIYFAPGRYRPDTPQGRQLLGHELAHVLQQRQGRVHAPPGAELAMVRDRALEAEAARLGVLASSTLERQTVGAKPKPGRPDTRQRTVQRMLDNKVPNKWGTLNTDPLLIEDWKDDYRTTLVSLSEYRVNRSIDFENVLDSEFIAQRFKLDVHERLALHCYGSPGKDEVSSEFYMGAHSKWGIHKTGWVALNSAIEKLPSFEKLGLENLSLFRVERAGSMLFKQLSKVEHAYVFHGVRVMNFGQYHLLSTSLIESTAHSALKENYNRGLFIYRSKSARYMNNFSVQGLLDGGESLIPSGTISYFVGMQKVYWLGDLVDCAVLEEVGTIDLLKEKHKLDLRWKSFEDHLTADITLWAKQDDFYQGYDGWNKYSKLTGISFDLKDDLKKTPKFK